MKLLFCCIFSRLSKQITNQTHSSSYKLKVVCTNYTKKITINLYFLNIENIIIKFRELHIEGASENKIKTNFTEFILILYKLFIKQCK